MESRKMKDGAELIRPGGRDNNGHTHSSTSTTSTPSRIQVPRNAAAEQAPIPTTETPRSSSEATSADDSESESPNPNETSPSFLSTLRGWGQQATAIFTTFKRQAVSSLSTSRADNIATSEDSGSTTPDSRTGWDRVERWEVQNGRYEHFVEQQDAREYDIIDAREAESGDEGEDEVEDLGGEKWDKTLL